MDTQSYITGFAAGIVASQLYARSMKVDTQLESKMLDFLKANKEFTVSQFAKESGLGLGFFAKHKIRMAASILAKTGKINCEIPKSSTIFNRDETVKFLYK